MELVKLFNFLKATNSILFMQFEPLLLCFTPCNRFDLWPSRFSVYFKLFSLGKLIFIRRVKRWKLKKKSKQFYALWREFNEKKITWEYKRSCFMRCALSKVFFTSLWILYTVLVPGWNDILLCDWMAIVKFSWEFLCAVPHRINE